MERDVWWWLISLVGFGFGELDDFLNSSEGPSWHDPSRRKETGKESRPRHVANSTAAFKDTYNYKTID
jgi:hypothetical protein